MASTQLDLDVLIVGAGISGINAAYRLQTDGPANSRYAIFEARHDLGGTWDFFRYPGIRSDSDIYTFGFSWKPWHKPETVAQGADIKSYMTEAVRETGIDTHIRYHHRVVAADWHSKDQCWEVRYEVGDGAAAAATTQTLRTRFILLGTGYYDYDTPMKAAIPGIDNFAGKVIHPQFWPEDYDYTDKHMVVIGSGATAITVVPAVSARVQHVTMLQRSPTYIMPIPKQSLAARFLFALLPRFLAHRLNRSLWIAQSYVMIYFCRLFPNVARALIRSVNRRLLPKSVSIDPHFSPAYKPWQQRLCASMDGDIFAAIRCGKASIVTDHIETVTATSIKLKSGAELHPDVIVTATGLGLRFAGGMQISIDGAPFDVTQKFIYRASMLQDLPNLVYVVGYENASWTLGADCAAKVLVRVVNELKAGGNTSATPRLANPDAMQVRPLLNLGSTYLQKANTVFPKGGTGAWAPRSTYLADLYKATYGDLKSEMEIV
ncbi:flavin-binding monooxygenase, putative [Cordyceps militaris CM01]|uniref:Flavin-binding monooxygenase, putative n=2 Tax=Cordyceps militaris TaxID=73501 RepID=G3JIL0_CORMM|nr:flavin-binding monooxygenase, putative [Cordyceps militaris CM01]ATY59097.1 Flavin monooxygenase [Cordyceps militaris]EGX91907.1 flavin-binding monooxygenase, putative [Cordyceps militaris CM01]